MNSELRTQNPELHRQLISLAEAAGQAIMAVYSQFGMAVDTKEDDSPVTEADLAAHRVICRGLAELAPDVPVLSEEGGIPDFDVRSGWPCYWLVDPLDGTKEFIGRNGEFTVNIALIEHHAPVLGVVHVPCKQLTYVGVRGGGAFKYQRGTPQPIQVRAMPEEGVTLVASRRHGAGAVADLLTRLEDKRGPVQTRSMGSSLKFCLVAEGEADLYPRLAPTAEWDTAAAQAVVEAAGGVVVDTDFQPLLYNAKADLLNPFFYVIGDTRFNWVNYL